MNKRNVDLEAIKRTIKNTGEIRLHVAYGRTGFVRCRIWHHDGFTLGTADGGGYDKQGAATAEALMHLIGDEITALAKRKANKAGVLPRDLYGLSLFEGRAILDGACGTVDKIVQALGYSWESYATGKDSRMIIMRKPV